MATRPRIFILVAIEDSEQRDRLLELLDGRLPDPPEPFDSIRLERHSLAEVKLRIEEIRQASRNSGVVLISDGLVEEEDFQKPTSNSYFREDLFDAFDESLFTSIAVMRHPKKVVDIERSISRAIDSVELNDAIDRCVRKLAYLRRPPRAQRNDPERYCLRTLRCEHELLDYFRLRYDVYSVMCYLHRTAESVPSRLEIDWFDKASIHLGVYFREDGFERLVGTGRLIASDEIQGIVPDEVSRIADSDPRLADELANNAVALRLPVFQSCDLCDQFARMLDQGAVVGEVSRVIVAPEHRGQGLSRRITMRLVDLAKSAGLSDLLLECLPIHTGIYRKCAFERIGSGKPYRISRTMDVMALPIQPDSIFRSISARQDRATPRHNQLPRRSGPKASY